MNSFDVVNFLRFAALAAWGTFIAWYWIRARWWESPVGRNIMGVAFAIFALLALIAAQALWPDYQARTALQVVVYGGIAALAIQRTGQMEHAQRHHKLPEDIERRHTKPRSAR